MNAQILQALEQLERDRGINKEVVIETIKSAVVQALRKKFSDIDKLEIEFDNEDGEIRVYAVKRVAKGKARNINEIGLQTAREHDPDIKIGDNIKIELAPESVGRIAAQTARQIIVHKFKDAEKDSIFNFYQKKINTVEMLKVQKVNADGSVLVELEKLEAVILKKDQIPGEKFRSNKIIKALIADVRKTTRGPVVYLSRTHPEFLKKLFEQEIPEIEEGIIHIKSVAREPGSRSKIAVFSDHEKIDSVGACVGVKGVRIQQVVNELRGEKIDVIRYSDDIRKYITNALAPSDVISIEIKENGGITETEVVVPDHHLSLAIGKEGQNVRLAARLVGVKIDILSESQKKEKVEKML
ncbi:MAG: transcription termination factor NusA [Candidatus Muiribacteriota bacterium]